MKTPRYVVLLRMTVIVLLFTAVLAPAASAAPSAGTGCPPVYYRIQKGDTLAKIAYRHGVTTGQLQQWNGIHNPDKIYWGNVLAIYPSRCAKPAPVHRPAPKPTHKPAPMISIPPAPVHSPHPGPMPWHPGCCGPVASPAVAITSPGPNAHVRGMLTITGSAADDDFAYYKLEFGAGSNPSDWTWFAGGESQVSYGTLGVLNTGLLACGTYTIRLVVVDNTGNFPTPAQVTVVVIR